MTAFLTVFRRFLITFRRFIKMSEDFRKLPKTFEADPKMFRPYTSELKFTNEQKKNFIAVKSYRYPHWWIKISQRKKKQYLFQKKNVQRVLPETKFVLKQWAKKKDSCKLKILRLRSKLSRTTRTKFGPRERGFSQSGCTKNEARAKKWKEGVGEWKGGKSLLLSLYFSRSQNFVRFVRERLLHRREKSLPPSPHPTSPPRSLF